MQVNRFSSLVWLLIVLLSGCAEPTLAEKLSGVWESVEIIGDTSKYPGNYEIQLEINESGIVNIITVIKTSEETKVHRGSGKIEGEYIVFSKNEISKIITEGDLLKMVVIKSNVTIIFKRVNR